MEIIQCQLLCDSIAVQQIIWCIVRRVHDKLLHDFRWAIGRNKLMTSRRRAGSGGHVLLVIPTYIIPGVDTESSFEYKCDKSGYAFV